jgi:hypothetical protein
LSWIPRVDLIEQLWFLSACSTSRRFIALATRLVYPG